MMQRNTILLGDCRDEMKELEESCIPLTVTSPPYDDLRAYSGSPWTFDVFQDIAKQLYRITTPGGVVCWIVQDQVVNGSLSGTKFRQVQHFMKLGFLLSHELIMVSKGYRNQSRRYTNQAQVCYVFSKGRPTTINLIQDRPNRTAGTKARFAKCDKFGQRKTFFTGYTIQDYGSRTNIWEYKVGGSMTTTDKIAFEAHSALMPEAMAEDLVISFSNPGDLVFDPMAGTGTTCKMAWLNGRDFLGMEIWSQAYNAGVERMANARRKHLSAIDDLLAKGVLLKKK